MVKSDAKEAGEQLKLRIPSELKERLQQQASRNRRSLNNEVICVLEWSVMGLPQPKPLAY